MVRIKNFFNTLDKTDLKIMKCGLKFCFGLLIIAIIILSLYLFLSHTLFIYELGMSFFKLSTYFAVEFIVCGIAADTIKKQL